MPACKFMKKNSFTHSLSCILPSFSRNASRLLLLLFNHDSSKTTIFMLNMSFDVLLSAVFVKLESFVSCNIKLFALCFDGYFFLLKLNYSPSWWYNFLFWHLYQIHNFNNNLNEEGMITSHLMCASFFMIKMLL